MESYVIRIYRRYESEPDRFVGLVEHPENGTVDRFSGVNELLNILLSSHKNGTTSSTQAAAKLLGTNQAVYKGQDEKVVGILNRYRIK